MKMQYVIKKPILTEKAHEQMKQGLYTFLVDKKAAKSEIKKAISQQFSVSVEKVNISRIAPKSKRVAKGRKTVKVGGGKKATVWVKKGQSITSLLPKAQQKQTKSAKAEGPERSRREKEAEKASAEGKEG